MVSQNLIIHTLTDRNAKGSTHAVVHRLLNRTASEELNSLLITFFTLPESAVVCVLTVSALLQHIHTHTRFSSLTITPAPTA